VKLDIRHAVTYALHQETETELIISKHFAIHVISVFSPSRVCDAE